ncbi:hypothetical protein SAY87_015660 [Trapa incisa]|uniref:Uncharacterized protein n=1 Tax=Trapa incisa TaxID=236973 RepID=A0AAN7QTU3_9MYRT|nr:hypothetical protein SAY87_015660 [Trapa incisa]
MQIFTGESLNVLVRWMLLVRPGRGFIMGRILDPGARVIGTATDDSVVGLLGLITWIMMDQFQLVKMVIHSTAHLLIAPMRKPSPRSFLSLQMDLMHPADKFNSQVQGQ